MLFFLLSCFLSSCTFVKCIHCNKNNVLRKRKNKSKRWPFDKLKIRPIQVPRIKHVVIIFLRKEGFSFFVLKFKINRQHFCQKKTICHEMAGNLNFRIYSCCVILDLQLEKTLRIFLYLLFIE